MKGNFSNPDKRKIEALANEGIAWIEDNANADTDAIAAKKKEIEDQYNPIMVAMYAEAGGKPKEFGL